MLSMGKEALFFLEIERTFAEGERKRQFPIAETWEERWRFKQSPITTIRNKGIRQEAYFAKGVGWI